MTFWIKVWLWCWEIAVDDILMQCYSYFAVAEDKVIVIICDAWWSVWVFFCLVRTEWLRWTYGENDAIWWIAWGFQGFRAKSADYYAVFKSDYQKQIFMMVDVVVEVVLNFSIKFVKQFVLKRHFACWRFYDRGQYRFCFDIRILNQIAALE